MRESTAETKKRPMLWERPTLWDEAKAPYRGLVLILLGLLTATNLQMAMGRRMAFLEELAQQDSPTLNRTTGTTVTVPQNDNSKIPGLFWNRTLYLLGARLTTSYDPLEDPSVSFDLFGHAVGEGANPRYGMAEVDPGETRSYRNASQQVFFCQSTTGDRVRMEWVPQRSMDGNTPNVHLIWRCPLSTVSPSDLLAVTPIRVSVFAGNHSSSRDPILTVDVPTDTATVGHAGPLIAAKRVLQEGPLGVVLCVAGITNHSMWYLPEFLQHHLNVGVEQFFLGVDHMEDLPYFEEKLAHFIEAGVVVLGGDPKIPAQGPGYPGFDDRQTRKLRVYNQCLYHAKGVSEFLAIWDIDELWVPPVVGNHSTYDNTQLPNVTNRIQNDELWKESNYSQTLSLPQAIRSLRGKNGCVDWCFQTFPSYTVRRAKKKQEGATDPALQGYFGFSVRDPGMANAWQKPIIRTKYAHQASFHLGGSCRRPPFRLDDPQEYSNHLKDCPLSKEKDDALGSMHHHYSLFRTPRRRDREARGKKALDLLHLEEYAEYFRPTTLKQLQLLQGKVQGEDPVWLEGQNASLPT